ncbi:MAG: addiction module protein [Alphaproteobacteria bacterium]|nr:addiction module protein [Alphaproteobacteria bacterium]MCW5742798.1 addiction module protein [Alphaproteobacteria bacterium]
MATGGPLRRELGKLSPGERLRLAHELIDSVAGEEMPPPPLTEEQLVELRERVARYRADKDARRWTLEEILSERSRD